VPWERPGAATERPGSARRVQGAFGGRSGSVRGALSERQGNARRVTRGSHGTFEGTSSERPDKVMGKVAGAFRIACLASAGCWRAGHGAFQERSGGVRGAFQERSGDRSESVRARFWGASGDRSGESDRGAFLGAFGERSGESDRGASGERSESVQGAFGELPGGTIGPRSLYVKHCRCSDLTSAWSQYS